jgi:hypothetical protein
MMRLTVLSGRGLSGRREEELHRYQLQQMMLFSGGGAAGSSVAVKHDVRGAGS